MKSSLDVLLSAVTALVSMGAGTLLIGFIMDVVVRASWWPEEPRRQIVYSAIVSGSIVSLTMILDTIL